jgi:hypothetical protein
MYLFLFNKNLLKQLRTKKLISIFTENSWWENYRRIFLVIVQSIRNNTFFKLRLSLTYLFEIPRKFNAFLSE